jgi:hypothetical protein
MLSIGEGSVFEFSNNYRFFLRRAQDRLLAPQNDSSHEVFRKLLSAACADLKIGAWSFDIWDDVTGASGATVQSEVPTLAPLGERAASHRRRHQPGRAG